MFKDLLDALEASIGLQNTMREIPIESDEYKAYVFRSYGGYGVCIPYSGRNEINEKFNNVVFRTWNINGVNCLCLWTDAVDLVAAFATMAWDFVSPGPMGKNRITLQNTPFQWFEKWKSMVGNYARDLMVYDVIGELKVFLLLANDGKKPVWSSQTLSSHDIEADGSVYEVKTTLTHSGRTVTISSLEQMEKENDLPLYLCLVRVQESTNGDTIEKLRNEIVERGLIAANEIDSYLLKKGYSSSKSEYRKGYQVYRISSFLIDESFPKLRITDFVDNKLPHGVESVSYTISLPSENEVTLFPRNTD